MKISTETILIGMSLFGLIILFGSYYSIKDAGDIDYYKVEQYISNNNHYIVINRINLLTNKCFKKYKNAVGKHLCYRVHVSTKENITLDELRENIYEKDYSYVINLKNNVIRKNDLIYIYYKNEDNFKGIMVFSGINM